MSRVKPPPRRQPRGRRATLPAPQPRPDRPSELDFRIGAACCDCCRWVDDCECPVD